MTSADRLHAGWTAAQRARWHGEPGARAQVERLLAPLPRHCRLVTVIDGYPATLSWLGSVAGHQTIPLGSSISARPAPSASFTAISASTPARSCARCRG